MGKILALLAACAFGSLITYFFASEFAPSFIPDSAPKSHSSGIEPLQRPVSSTRRSETVGVQETVLNLGEIEALDYDFEQTHALYVLLARQDVNGIIALLDNAKSRIHGRDYVSATSIIYGRLAELDFDTALRRVEHTPGYAPRSWYRAIFHAYARINLDKAIDAAINLPNSSKRIAGRAILQSRDDLSIDDQQAIAATLNIQVPLELLDQNLADAWAQAMIEPNLRSRTKQLREIALQWARTDPQAAIDASNILPLATRMRVQGKILWQWADIDPDSAWAWVESLPPSNQRNTLVQSAIGFLADHDLERARTIAESLNPNAQRQAYAAISKSWVSQDPASFLVWFENEDNQQSRHSLIRRVTLSLSQDSPELVDQFMSLLTPEEFNRANISLISSLAQQDPERAAERVSDIRETKQRARAAQSLVSQWAQSDREAAMRWIDRQPVDERAQLDVALVSAWASWDPDKALDYAHSIRDPKARDSAVMAVAAQSGDIDYMERAYQEIVDPKLKQQAATYLYRVLRHSDLARANLYKEEVGLETQSSR